MVKRQYRANTETSGPHRDCKVGICPLGEIFDTFTENEVDSMNMLNEFNGFMTEAAQEKTTKHMLRGAVLVGHRAVRVVHQSDIRLMFD
jgi:hypothetical protein